MSEADRPLTSEQRIKELEQQLELANQKAQFTGVGGHGVVGILKSGLPGKVFALRADMDALPVQEATGLPFASKAAANGKIMQVPKAAGAEDFSEYQQVAPGVFFILGVKPEDRPVGPPHSPIFDLDESSFPVGMRSLAMVALTYLENN